MRVRPLTPDALASELADHIASTATRWRRVAIDGADAAGTGRFADALVEPLRLLGHPVIRISMTHYLRPASLRLERGRTDPDSYYSEWFDLDGLRREVLNPLASDGNGHVLPALRDPERDRSPRLDRVPLAEGGAVLVDGPLLLGAGLPFDFTVHLWLEPNALERLTQEAERWTLPALRRYDEEVQPQRSADYVVRVDRPGRPAVVDSLTD